MEGGMDRDIFLWGILSKNKSYSVHQTIQETVDSPSLKMIKLRPDDHLSLYIYELRVGLD